MSRYFLVLLIDSTADNGRGGQDAKTDDRPRRAEAGRLPRGTASVAGEDREHVGALRRTVNGASVVRSADIPADVVTLHSRARVSGLDDAGDATYTLVAGTQGATPSAISVMSPMGVALL